MTDTTCTATLRSPGETAHTCMSLAPHETSPHRCSCGVNWRTATATVLRHVEPAPEVDDEPATVESVREWLTDAAETLDGLVTDLHELKRRVGEEHRESIMVAANGVGQAWAQARIALTALTDVPA